MSKLAMASERARTARKNRQNQNQNQQQNLGQGKGGGTPNPAKVMQALNNASSNSISVGVGGGLSPDDIVSSAGVPTNLMDHEKPIWDAAIELMRDPVILPMFEAHSSHLMLIFDAYSHGKGRSEGHQVKTLPLMGPTGTKKGAIVMAGNYDIVPSFLSKKEVKSCYSVVALMQSGKSGGGLDFSGFIQLLGLLAVVSLSKPSFQHLYPSNGSKVGVLLEMWGFSDPIKLQMMIRGKQ
tara:strand:- start:13 stop:726 length:714 start_codon:yes stop_codon:yes gene_type:complete